MQQTQNLNVSSITNLISPENLIKETLFDDKAVNSIVNFRNDISKIIAKKDNRMLLIVGPCSIHDEEAAFEYGQKLAKLREQYKEKLYIAMRVYFEKPRTTVGWKGLINDPHLDGSYDLETGLRKARKILLKFLEMGLPTASEFLDPIVPQFTSDLVCWAAIGARTTESQTHRQMASGLSMPVGFKNSTDGNVQVAIDAMQSANHAHHFIGVDEKGQISVVATKGNLYSHIILRGGNKLPNFYPDNVADLVDKLESSKLNTGIVVDCSHANSGKKFEQQEAVWKNIIDQRKAGNTSLIGMMLESNIKEGNQKIQADLSKLEYGVSITDACVSIEKTEELLDYAANNL